MHTTRKRPRKWLGPTLRINCRATIRRVIEGNMEEGGGL